MREAEIVIIGGGPAGLAAAVAAKKAGVRDIHLLERDKVLGGILNQCIHNGFGLHTFGEELTGPEYAARFEEMVEKEGILYRLNTMVTDLSEDLVVTAVNEEGILKIKAKAVILAMGCRERARGALNIPGYRPAGVYTAGTAQRLMNIEGFRVGKEALILGSGDIGLIMARRMTLEGAKVKAVAELLPFSGGLKRNIVQCLDDFNIPLKLSHTVVKIHGKERVTGVTLSKVGKDRKPLRGTEEYFSCDTLLLSVGLIPENELSKKAGVEIDPVSGGPVVDDRLTTGVKGIFACGNVLHVHDLVDFVSKEAEVAGRYAAEFVKKGREKEKFLPVVAGEGVRYAVPQIIRVKTMEDRLTVRFRVDDVYREKAVSVYLNQERIIHKKKRIFTPGEMEEVTLSKQLLEKKEGERILIRIEGE